ncbi:hypothetical protein Dimus_038568 [Dionaea muscipula]
MANTVAIHFESLRGGLRIPLHPFIQDILNLHHLLPGQLSPNTYTVLVAYIIKCGQLGYKPSLEVWYWMFGLSPMKESKSSADSGYYTFSAVTKGKKAIKYGVVKTRSNVHNWKHKFVLVSCRTWGVSTEQREVYTKPQRDMRAYLNKEERLMLETFQSEGKESLDEWFDVVTLDNIEHYSIATRTHPRRTIHFELILNLNSSVLL